MPVSKDPHRSNVTGIGRARRPLAPLAAGDGAPPDRVEAARVFEDPGCPHRGRFQLDRDRILYSGSFRKLQYKTQVFVTHEGDLYRTRMTHTIEVMQIARSIAGMLGLNEMLAEAIALVHDIGHPPFGHGGETTLDSLTSGRGGFDHNVQGLRVVEKLERVYPDFRGLNLCWETREGMARHNTIFDHPPLLPEFGIYSQPSAECQVVDAADTIAFCTHDLDDALRIGLVGREWLESKADEIPLIARLLGVMNESTAHPAWDLGSSEGDVGRMRAISAMIGELIEDVVDTTRFAISSSEVQTAEQVRLLEGRLVSFSQEAGAQVEMICRAMLGEVYTSPIIGRMIYKGERMLGGIYDAFLEKPDLLPRELKDDAEADGLERAVCDYLAGMTDRFAMDLYAMLYQPNVRTTDWF